MRDRSRIFLLAASLLLLAGCARQSPALPAETGSPKATSPSPPTEARGPAAGHIPVPKEQGNWAARGATPEEAARLFLLGAEQPCECDSVVVTTLESSQGQAILLVRQNGLKDDAIRDLEHRITLAKIDSRWQVTAASFTTICRRWVSADGYCL